MRNPAFKKIKDNVQKILKGQDNAIELTIIAFFAQSHVLIEDIPGVGKTTLAKAFAKSIDLPMQRIQFTADLLPSDILGVSVYDRSTDSFNFHKGPIFTNILLADEINRAEPRTQSALLEAMHEKQVTVDKNSYPLHSPFMLLATQNPADFFGTFPLPEAQLDRFLFKFALGYPDAQTEAQILKNQKYHDPLDKLIPVISKNECLQIFSQIDDIHVDDSIIQRILKLAKATRSHPAIALGISTRASIALLNAAKIRALAYQRDFLIPEDIEELTIPALSHRIRPQNHALAMSNNDLNADILRDILKNI